MTDYVPLSQMRTVAWRGCAGCNGTLLLDEAQAATAEAGDRAGAYLLCGSCRKIADAEQAKRPVAVGARCVLRLWQSGPFADLFITAVDGDSITVGVLGLGGVEPGRVREILGRCWPAGLWDRDPLAFDRSELMMKGL
jgi:hypothetical protein